MDILHAAHLLKELADIYGYKLTTMDICTCCFRDFLAKCNDTIPVFAQLEPDTSYYWVITDKFGNQYQDQFDTDSDGFWQIDASALPEGLLTEFSGEFKLQVFKQTNTCAPATFKIAQVTDCIVFDIHPGNRVKSQLGCSF